MMPMSPFPAADLVQGKTLPQVSDTRVSPDLAAKIGQPAAFFLQNYRQYGPVYCFYRAGQRFTVLAGPEANEFITAYGRELLRSHDLRAAQIAEYGVGRTLLSTNGPVHDGWRHAQRRGYSRAALNERHTHLIALVRTQARQWLAGQVLTVTDFMARLIIRQLGLGTLGVSPEGYVEDLIRFVRLSVMVTTAGLLPPSALEDPAYRASKARVMEYADSVIAFHRAVPVGERPPSLVDDLLAALATDPGFMSEQELRVAILTPFIGGLDSTANTCGFLLYALLRHPHVLERALLEIDSAFDAGDPAPAAVRDLKVLHRAILETLRLYPVSPAIQGTAARPFEFGGYPIDAGEYVVVGSTVPHHLEEIYPDPFRFDTERFTAPRSEHLRPGAFAPYGLGEHICLGAGQAEAMMMLTMATLLHAVRLELVPDQAALRIQMTPAPAPDRSLQVRVVEHRRPLDPS